MMGGQMGAQNQPQAMPQQMAQPQQVPQQPQGVFAQMQQDLNQWSENAAGNPMFHLGAAIMSGGDMGKALTQGVALAQQMKQNRFSNNLRLIELQAKLNPGQQAPTTAERNVMTALGTTDPANPKVAELMMKYLFKPSGSTVNVNSGQRGAQFEPNVPGFMGWVDPDDISKGYAVQDDTMPGGVRVEQIAGTQKPDTAAHKAAAQADVLRQAVPQINEFAEYQQRSPGAALASQAAQSASNLPVIGPAIGAGARAAGIISPEGEAGQAAVDQASAIIGSQLFGADVTDEQRKTLDRMIRPSPGEGKQAALMRRNLLNAITSASQTQSVVTKAQAAQWINQAQSAGIKPSQESSVDLQNEEDQKSWFENLLNRAGG